MKIAIVAPPFLPIPPPEYGGTEKIIHYLTEGLVKRGFDVTLFASGDSQTAAKLVPLIEKHYGNSGYLKHEYMPLLRYYSAAFKDHEQFDIIHSHGQYIPLFFTNLIHEKPVVHTWHGSYYEGETHQENRPTLKMMKDQKYISISDNQQQGLPELNYVGRVYNGIDLSLYNFKADSPRDYLVWVGRIVEKKGPKAAILAALKAGIPLHMAAAIDPIEQSYFEAEIKPYIDNKNIFFRGELHAAEINTLLQNALCTLFPITWHEPFGLVMAESMACGTPVVGYDIGSVSEIVKDGETGYVVDNSDGLGVDRLVDAIKKLKEMPEETYNQIRSTSRKRVEENFTIDKMVEGYIEIYKKLAKIDP